MSQPCSWTGSSCWKITKNRNYSNTTGTSSDFGNIHFLGQSPFFLRQRSWKWSAAGSSAWFSKETTNQTLQEQWRLALGSCGCFGCSCVPPCSSSLLFQLELTPTMWPKIWLFSQITPCLQISLNPFCAAWWCPGADPELWVQDHLQPPNSPLAMLERRFGPWILKQSKALCRCPESGKAQMVCLGLLKCWPCCLIVPLCTGFQEGGIKATRSILLLRSGSCLPSPVSHSLIKSFLLIQPVPNRNLP